MSSSQRLDAFDDPLSHKRDVRKRYSGVDTPAKQWHQGELSIHAHLGLARFDGNGRGELQLGDWCARFDRAWPREELREVLEDDFGIGAAGFEENPLWCDDGRYYFSMLVSVRETTKPTDSTRAVPASVGLIALEECPMGFVGDAGCSAFLPIGEARGAVVHGELNIATLDHGELGTEATSQFPRRMVESAPIVVDCVSKDEREVRAELRNAGIDKHRDVDDALIAIRAISGLVLLQIEAGRITLKLRKAEKIRLKHVSVMLTPIPLPPGTREWASPHGE